MRKVLVLSLILLADVMAWAQMSDEKIIEFVQEQQANGASQEQIVLELNRKGVSIQQLQRMRDKYEKQYSTGVLGNTIQSQGVNSRSRNEVSQSSKLLNEKDQGSLRLLQKQGPELTCVIANQRLLRSLPLKERGAKVQLYTRGAEVPVPFAPTE